MERLQTRPQLSSHQSGMDGSFDKSLLLLLLSVRAVSLLLEILTSQSG